MSTHQASSQPEGSFHLRVVRAGPPIVQTEVPERPLSIHEMIHYGFPRRSMAPEVRVWKTQNARYFWTGFKRIIAARVLRLPMLYGRLTLLVLREDGRIEDLGLVGIGNAMVTTAGVVFLAARMANVTPANIANFNYHAIGTGTNAAATSDTALQTEITTQYAVNSTRPTGTQSTPGSTNIYQTTVTITPDAQVVNTEWGLFDQAASGGTLLDRRVYAVVTLNGSGDSAIPTYQLTLPAGG